MQHGTYPIILQMEKEAFESPNLKKLFTNSRMVKQQILGTFSTSPEKIQVIHNGVEWQEMQEDFDHSFDHRSQFSNAFQLLFIGNGYLRKGLGPLLEGLARLNRKDVHLSIVGKDRQEQRYKAKAIQLGLAKQVHFFGAQQNIRPFYQKADALAIPSFYDPFANVTVEALAMGLFVLSSKFNGGSEVLTAKTGVVVEDLLSVDAMVDGLNTTISYIKSKKNALQCRRSVEHLDYQKQMNTLIEACFASR